MRLIKKQDQSAALCQRINFLDDPEDQISAAKVSPWLEPAFVQPLTGASRDPARVEKAAYENGFRQGEKAGLELAEKKVDALMRRYADAIREIGSLKPKLYQQAERDVVRLALEVAKKIVHREIQLDPEIIQTLVKIALNHVAVRSAVTVHLNPADYAYILKQREAAGRPVDGDPETVLLADKSIDRGGCLIETECGDVDARIEEEFREVERAFFGGKD